MFLLFSYVPYFSLELPVFLLFSIFFLPFPLFRDVLTLFHQFCLTLTCIFLSYITILEKNYIPFILPLRFPSLSYLSQKLLMYLDVHPSLLPYHPFKGLSFLYFLSIPSCEHPFSVVLYQKRRLLTLSLVFKRKIPRHLPVLFG